MTRIFFATDVHGSEKCFGKFLNAWKFYKSSVIILGGDLTGKVIVPIIDNGAGLFTCNFLGSSYEMHSENEVQTFEKNLRFSGYYPFRTDKQNLEALNASKDKQDELFTRLMDDTLKRWITQAEEKLKPNKIRMYVTGGNDDKFEIEPILKSSDYVIDAEGEVVRLDDDHEMISSGYSNITPWSCPRDITEEELEVKIAAMADRVENMQNCIFNLHCPPYDSGLDTAPELDKNLKPVFRSGQLSQIPVGSKAVRSALEKYKPLLGLHGHIHESRGEAEVGRTLCLNPGSEYTEGILRGVILDLDKNRIKSWQFTSG